MNMRCTPASISKGSEFCANAAAIAAPPDVPPIEPDVRGASTIQEQLAKHRTIAQCAACHQKIDPYGMALENFDVIGGWRENYRALVPTKNPKRPQLGKGKPVSAADQLPRLGAFKDFEEFRGLLKKNEPLVFHNVAEKLATYALGRQMTFADRPDLGKALAGADDYLRGEIVYAATHEGARHLGDTLTRRTRISIEYFDRGTNVAEEVAELMGEVLGWSAEQRLREVDHYRKRVEAERESQTMPDDETADAARMGAPDVVPVVRETPVKRARKAPAKKPVA